jgi:tetratricopeptide (TPR) repeat protein
MDVRAKAYMQALSELDLVGLQGLLDCGDDPLSSALSERLSSLMVPIWLSAETPDLQDVIRLREEGHPELSLQKIDQQLRLGEENPWWLENKARALVDLDNAIEAISIWEKLLKFPDVDHLVATANQMLMLYRPLALKPLMDFCDLAKWSPVALDQGIKGELSLLDSVLIELSRLAQAERNYVGLGLADHALMQGFSSPWLWLAKARALAALGKREEARHWFMLLAEDSGDHGISQLALQGLSGLGLPAGEAHSRSD